MLPGKGAGRCAFAGTAPTHTAGCSGSFVRRMAGHCSRAHVARKERGPLCFRRDSAANCGMQRLIRAAHGRALRPRAGCPEWARAVVLSPGQRRILRYAAAHSCGAWSGIAAARRSRIRGEGSRRAVQVNRLLRASAGAPCNSALHPHFMPLPLKSAHPPHPAIQHVPSPPAQKRAWSCGSAAQARFIPDMHVTPSPGRPSPFPHRASTALRQALPIKRDTAP